MSTTRTGTPSTRSPTASPRCSSRWLWARAVRDRRATVFRAAVGVAALHALIVPADHAVSRLAPMAVALGAAAAYPRLPGGARALVALACGAPALAPGVLLAPAGAA